MSSKAKETARKKDGKHEVVPKLRFPQFRNAKEWVASPLIRLSSVGLSNGVFNDPKKVGTGYKLINVSDMYIDTTIRMPIWFGSRRTSKRQRSNTMNS